MVDAVEDRGRRILIEHDLRPGHEDVRGAHPAELAVDVLERVEFDRGVVVEDDRPGVDQLQRPVTTPCGS